MPTASVVTGTYHENQSVTLETTAPGGTIRYTLDNTAPNDSSPVYGSAIEIDRTVTLKAITVKEGMITSQPMTVIYTLTPETPTANPPSGTYHEVQTVTLATATSGAEIYYTTDYSDPAASTTKYTGSISINVTTTVRAIAKKTGWTNSTEFTALYTLQVQPPAVLTVEVALAVTDNNTSKTDISVGLSGSGANQTMTLSVVEEPVVYFVVSKEAGQTITVSDDEANHVTMVTSGDLDGSTAGDDGVLFGVNMEDLLFDGAFGETDSFNANVIPSGTETRTFTLTVAETGKTSRTIAVSLNITLDQTTETSIYHREGTEGAYHYVKVRDAKLTAADRTAQSTTASLEAMETGPVTDLQNAFVWVDRHGEAGDNHNGYENGTTEGYSEYRLFVKKSQEIGKMCFMIVNTPGKRISSKWQDIDLRENISIELYGAGLPGVTTTTQGREQKITRNATFSTDPAVQALNGTGNGVKSGFLSVTNNYTAKYKALVLGKNITIAGDGSNNPVSISGEGPWKMLAASTLIYVAANGMLIMHDHSKVTDYYTEEAYSPIQVAEVTSGGIFGKFYMYGGIITGNTFGNSVGVIKAFHTETSPVIFLKGGIIENNTNNDVIR
ncbi:MAG: chitobiase/beta-hexosaminidase C-terminal domain-containing protein [Spirochaetaceae bacterium]|nr:chitobiase/beta-hexosaminidase C-terminal domain-containing protein [Spirochaetaceae bacterium]